MFTTIDEINTFLQNRKKIGMKLGLERIKKLLNDAGNPDRSLPIIHVAGTNGKGSTIHYIDEALRASCYRTGIFSSPSLTDVRGYFTLNGEESDADGMIEAMNELYDSILFMDQVGDSPTEFEIVTALAFVYFAPRVDIVIVETGMGGLLDTTNCITPLLSIITTVAKDHEQFLGNTIEAIATHKAGIIKKNRPVIVGSVPEAAKEVIVQQAKYMRAPYYMLGTEFSLLTVHEKTIVHIIKERYTIPPLRMKGSHQRNNVAVACMALHTLCRLGFSLNEEKCIQAIAHAKLPGRFEQIYDKPFMIVDSAHNVQAMHALLTTVRDEIGKRRVHVLFAAYRDKAWQEMVQLIRNECFSLTLTTFSDKRALTIDEICKSDMAKDVLIETDWRTYLTRAILMPNDEVYVITGSFRFIAMVRSWMKKNG